MESESRLKEIVRESYGGIASRGGRNEACCCSGSCCSGSENVMRESYDGMDGYDPDADLGLGCGLPTNFAKIKKGDTVIDLGSGAGNDCFVARAEAGETGRIIGVDFTPEMIERARANAKKLGYSNVEFVRGDIDDMPVDSGVADVVVSNCVLNLVPNKRAVFAEIHRVLKPGGHFSISDIVLGGDLPENIRSAAEMYWGCVSGAIEKDEYLGLVAEAGFANVAVQKEKTVTIPDEELVGHLSRDELAAFRKNPDVIRSVTVYAEK